MMVAAEDVMIAAVTPEITGTARSPSVVTMTGLDVVKFPAASRATAVRV
jgi:hypothetical protein